VAAFQHCTDPPPLPPLPTCTQPGAIGMMAEAGRVEVFGVGNGGPAAVPGDRLTVLYRAFIDDHSKVGHVGMLFDSCDDQHPYVFQLGCGEVIPGWEYVGCPPFLCACPLSHRINMGVLGALPPPPPHRIAIWVYWVLCPPPLNTALRYGCIGCCEMCSYHRLGAVLV
jgi:hypothetical protein